MMFWIWS